MKKEWFLEELEYLLSGVADTERQEALQYYRDFFEDAGPEQEEEVLQRLGSPEKIAMEIRCALEAESHDAEIKAAQTVGAEKKCCTGEDIKNGREACVEPKSRRRISVAGEFCDGEETESFGTPQPGMTDSLESENRAGEFTERGYRDGRFTEDYYVPDQYAELVRCDRAAEHSRRSNAPQDDTDDYSRKSGHRREKRRNTLLALVFIIIFGIPVASALIAAAVSLIGGVFGLVVGAIGGVFGLAIGLVGGLIGIVIACFGGAVWLFAWGVSLICQGISCLQTPAIGSMTIGFGFWAIAGAVLLVLAGKWGCTTAIPGVFRFYIGLVKKAIFYFTGLFHKIFQKAGERR